MTSQTTIRERRMRWEQFMRPGAAPGFLFIVRWNDPEAPEWIARWPSFQKERIEELWKGYQRHLLRVAWLEDDFIPNYNMITGTEIFAEAFGCPVYRPMDNMPSARPLIHTAAEVARLKVPDLSTSSLAYLFDMADELHRRDPQALFRLVDTQSPMDIATLIWEKSSFCVAMVETPEAVRELAYKVRQLLTAFLDEWFRRYGVSHVAHYPDYYMSRGITLSEDEVGIVSPDMFEEFFLPELVALSDHFGGIGMHCCANARHQWENFRKIPGLRLLNLVQPQAIIREATGFFADGPVQMHGVAKIGGGAEEWSGPFPANARVVMEVPVKTKDDAIAAARRLNAEREMKIRKGNG